MADQTFLYVHQMDETDYKLYRARLDRAWDIIDKSDDIKHDSKSKETRYRLPSGDGHYIAHVSRITDRQGRPYFKLWTDHTDGTSNFCITNPLRMGEKDLKPNQPDLVLDHLELMLGEADFAFCDRGAFGAAHRAKVEAMDKQSFEIINALIHAYMEFAEGKRFTLETHATKPYKPSSFFEITDGRRLEFLGERMLKRLDWFMPAVSKVEYRRREGMSLYEVGPMDPTEIVITAEDMPSEEEIVRILQPLVDVPQPHLLDYPTTVNVYGW
jgi:hypothetical protein